MAFLFALFIFFILISVIVSIITFIHELGHFLVAKYHKVRVAEFAIGFGPRLFGMKRGETTYSFRLLPFGGYVSVLSEDVVNEIDRIKREHPNLTFQEKQMIQKKMGGLSLEEDYSFQKPIEKISSPRRALFALGGVIFNFISIFAMFFVLNITYGREFNQDSIYIKNNFVPQYDQTVSEAPKEYIESEISFESLTYFSSIDQSDMNSTGYNDMNNFLTEDFEDVSYNFTGDEFVTDILNMDITTTNNNDIIIIESVLENFLVLDFEDNEILLNIDKLYNMHFQIAFSEETPETNFTTYNDEYNASRVVFFSNFYYLSDTGEKMKINVEANASSAILDLTGLSYYIPLEMDQTYGFIFYYDAVASDGTTNIEYLDVGTIDSNMNFDEYAIIAPVSIYQAVWYGISDTFVELWLAVYWLLNIISFGNLDNAMNIHSSSGYEEGWFFEAYYNLTKLLIYFSALVIIFNILPIPPLDGWRFMEYSYEGVKKKKIKKSTSTMVSRIGWGLMFMYFIVYLFWGFN